MALDDSASTIDLYAQILLLSEQNTSLLTKNAQLTEELESTRYELRETQALLGQAVVKANRHSQASSSSSPTLPTRSSSRRKRTSSPTSQHVGLPLPPSKKMKMRTRNGEDVAEVGLRQSANSSVRPRTSTTEKVKDSPGKPVKIELASGIDVISVNDDSDVPLPSEGHADPVPQTVVNNSADKPNHLADADSDFESDRDPNEEIDDTKRTPEEPEGTASSAETEKSRQTTEPLRRSARFSSRSSLTTLSTSVTPAATTPDVEDKPDLKPKREPKREPKQEDIFQLLSGIVARHLHSAKPLLIAPPPMTLRVPRKFLRLAYGGSDQQFVQFFPAERNPGPAFTVNAAGVKVPKDQRRVVFPRLNLNPSMPSAPGAPGLIFASRHDVLHNPPWTVFRERESGKAVWLYLGEYESELVGRMTPEEFMDQSVKVRTQWAGLITDALVQVCYMSMRARIVLRAAGLIPCDNKYTEEKLINDEVKNIRAKKGKAITTSQVLKALSNGDERIDILRMKCVKYDHFFANDIAKRLEDYPKMVAADKAAKKSKGKPTRPASGITSTSRRTGRQKQSKAKPSEDQSQSESEENSEGNSAKESRGYFRKGKGPQVVPSTSKPRLKSAGALLSRSNSRSTGTPTSSNSGSVRPRRRAVAAVTIVDDMEEGDNDDSDDYENEGSPEDDLSESDGA